jgi:hypothetical protein
LRLLVADAAAAEVAAWGWATVVAVCLTGGGWALLRRHRLLARERPGKRDEGSQPSCAWAMVEGE